MQELRTAGVRQALLSWTASPVSFAGTALSERLRPAFGRIADISHEAASALAAFLTPAAVVVLGFGIWRLGTDLGWTGQFIFSNGLFSHWQVWLALAAVLKLLASYILRANLRPASSVETKL